MNGSNLDAVFYCKEAPTIELRQGMFHICHKIGGLQIEFVMSPNTFLKLLRKGTKIADEFHEGMRNVFGMTRSEGDED